jgi:hypothetical protein
MSWPQSEDGDVCPHCGLMMMDWLDHEDECPYVRCDDPSCRALKAPSTVEELILACEHWKRHRLYAGCSHGR